MLLMFLWSTFSLMYTDSPHCIGYDYGEQNPLLVGVKHMLEMPYRESVETNHYQENTKICEFDGNSIIWTISSSSIQLKYVFLRQVVKRLYICF